MFAETFRFESSNIEIQDNGDLIYATKGRAISSDNNFEIEADKFEYIKKNDFLKAFQNGLVLIKSENLNIEFDEMSIDQKSLIINANGNIKDAAMDKILIKVHVPRVSAPGKKKLISFSSSLTAAERYSNCKL